MGVAGALPLHAEWRGAVTYVVDGAVTYVLTLILRAILLLRLEILLPEIGCCQQRCRGARGESLLPL